MRSFFTIILLFAIGLCQAQNDFAELDKEHNFEQVIKFHGYPGENELVWPKFIDGKAGLDKFIEETLEYPEQAKKEKISGTVVLSYSINSKGEIVDIVATSDTHTVLNQELIRVLKLSGPWIPGKKNGKHIKMKCSVSYEF